MSASGSEDPRTTIAFAERNWDSIGGVVGGGFMGVFLALYASGIDLINAIFNVLVLPLRQVGIQAADVMRQFIGGAAGIIEQGAETTVASLAPGATWAVGPLTFAFGIVAAVSGLYVMAWILARPETSDILPFTFTNVPLVGTEEQDNDQ